MKRIVLVLVSSIALSASGQAAHEKAPEVTIDTYGSVWFGHVPSAWEVELGHSGMPGGPQAGCPVQIVDATFERPARLMLAATGERADRPSLHLEYANKSGKPIQSMLLAGWIKVKDSPYQLDSVTREFKLLLSGEDAQKLKLVPNAVGFDRVELEQITYADGMTWKPARKNCVYRSVGSSLQVN